MIQQAIVDIDISISLSRNYADALLIKGKCIYVTGDFDSALKCYEQLKNIYPKEPMAPFHLGNLLMLNGDFEGAIKEYEKSISIKPNSSSYYQLSKCLILLENPQDAIAHLKNAVKINENLVYKRDLKSLEIFQETIINEKIEKFFTEMIEEVKMQKENDYKPLYNPNGQTDYCKIDMETMYKFPIFEIEDWTAYRGIMRMYMKKYSEALSDLTGLYEILLSKKKKYFESQEGSNADGGNFEKEINNLRFSPMTLNECKYNIAICHLLVNHFI